MLGMAGVATAIDSIPSSYTTLAASGKVYANDSYISHVRLFRVGMQLVDGVLIDQHPKEFSRSQ